MPRSEQIARLLVVPLAVLFGYLLLRGSGADGRDPVTTDGDPAATASERTGTSSAGAAEDATTTTAAAPTTTAAPVTTSSVVASATSTTAAPPTTGAGDATPVGPFGTYTDDGLVLEGSVPDEATAAAYARRLGRVLGAGNVAVRTTVDERVEADSLRIDVATSFPFPEDGAAFGTAFDPLLALSTALLDDLPEATLVVTGHTDGVGTDATNLALSVARARLVVDHLVDRGIAPDRVEAAGAGESQPVATNDTPEGRRQNSRITAVFEGITPDDG